MTIKQTLQTIGHNVGKNSPIILTATGVVGLGATAYFSYKSAKKVEVIVDGIEAVRSEQEYMERLEILKQERKLTDDQVLELDDLRGRVMPLDRMSVIKDLSAALTLPVLTGLASIACIGFSYKIQNNRILGLAGALASATAERAYYNAKYKATHGEEAYREFTTPTEKVKSMVKDAKGKDKEVETDVKKDIPSIHGEWFDKSTEYAVDDHDYNMHYIRTVNDKLDMKLFQKGHLLMNTVFEELGLPRTRQGALLGWSTATGFELSPDTTMIMNKETGELRPEIYVKWTTPTYIYETVELDGRYGI